LQKKKKKKRDIKRALLLKQSFYLLSRETSLSTATIPPLETIPLKVQELLQEFGDVFPKEISPELPPPRGIEHQIDLVPVMLVGLLWRLDL